MAISKVIYGGKTLIDLTADTVIAEKVLTGYTTHGADGETITGTCDYDSNTQDATAADAEILSGKTAYVKGTKKTGTMENNGAVTGTISNKDKPYVIPVGYHDGSGTVSISETEQAKLTPANIREGIEILGVKGTMTGSESEKKQSRSVKPTVNGFDVLPEDGYTCLSQVTVEPIPYTESDNSAGGVTVTIA